MSALTYRRCTESDLDVLRDLSITTFSRAFEAKNNPGDFQAYLAKAFSREQLRTEIRHPGMEFFLAYKDGNCCGYFKLNTGDAQTEFGEADGMEIERIYVLRDFQGSGAGAQMLEHIGRLARKAGKAYLWLGVWEHNPRAIAFYERAGFVKFGEHFYDIGTDRQTDWLMRLDLQSRSRS